MAPRSDTMRSKGTALDKNTRSRLWTPDCEAAPALPGSKPTTDDRAVRLRARKPTQAKGARSGKKKTRTVTGPGLEWSPQEMLGKLVCLETLWELAEASRRRYASRRASRPGPKRQYSDFEPLLVVAAKELLELSWNKTINMLGDPEQWKRLAKAVETTYPRHKNRRLASKPLTRNQYFWYRRHHWHDGIMREIKDILTEACLEAFVHIGGFSTDQKVGTLNHPDKSQMATGDGAWFRALYQATPEERDAAALEGITLLCSDDATDYFHKEFGKSRGYPVAMNTCRTGYRQERLLLTFDYVGEGETDATTCTRMACEMKEKFPEFTKGFLGMTYDLAISSTNADDLLNKAVLPLTKLKMSGRRRASRNLGEHTFTLKPGSDGRPRHERRRLLAYDGPPVLELVDANGSIHYEPLQRTKVFAKHYKNRSTVYVDYEVRDRPIVPPHLVGAKTRVRMNSTEEECEAKPIHRRRTTALRPISEFDADFDKLYGLREDSESNYSHIKDIMLLHGRVPAQDGRGTNLCFVSYQIKLLLTTLMAHHRRTGTSLKGWFGDHPPPYRGDPTY